MVERAKGNYKQLMMCLFYLAYSIQFEVHKQDIHKSQYQKQSSFIIQLTLRLN